MTEFWATATQSGAKDRSKSSNIKTVYLLLISPTADTHLPCEINQSLKLDRCICQNIIRSIQNSEVQRTHVPFDLSLLTKEIRMKFIQQTVGWVGEGRVKGRKAHSFQPTFFMDFLTSWQIFII